METSIGVGLDQIGACGVTTLLLTDTIACSLLARSGLPSSTLIPVTPSGSHN